MSTAWDPLSELSLDQLRRRTSLKWLRYPPDVLPAWVAEMDVPVAEPVVSAVAEAMELGDTGYATGSVYADALANFARDRWDWEIDVARTTIVPDVMRGAVELLRLVTDPGDAVVINPPVYPPFTGFIRHAEREVVYAPLHPGGRLDLEALERAFTDAAASHDGVAYLLCSPHNPTGTVHTRDELEQVAALAEAHDVRVISDEIHAPLVLGDASFVPYLAVDGSSRGFALHSASKGWNLPGLKAALAIAGEDSHADLDRIPEIVGHGVSHVGIIAHAAALRDGHDWLDATRASLARNRRLLAELLGHELPDVGYVPGDATFLAWLDCRRLGLGDDPAEVFLDAARIALSPGLDFGPGGEGHVRLNFATSPALLTEIVERMSRAISNG